MRSKTLVSILLFVVGFLLASVTITQVITMDRWLICIFFLILVSAVILRLFWNDIKNKVKDLNKRDWLILTASISIHFLTCYYIINHVDRPDWPFDSRGTSFLLMNDFFVWVKPFDVAVQQILITVLAIRLHNYGLKLSKIIIIFLIGFGSAHLAQFLNTDIWMGSVFVIGSLVLSVICPYMVLRVRNGWLYNFAIHLVGYSLAAIAAWTLY